VHNFSKIEEIDLQVPGESGVAHQTDKGYYGCGIYVSPKFRCKANSNGGYGKGAVECFLCLALPGFAYSATYPNDLGRSRVDGYDSHVSADNRDGDVGDQIVLFSSDQILPCFRVCDANQCTGEVAANNLVLHLTSNIA